MNKSTVLLPATFLFFASCQLNRKKRKNPLNPTLFSFSLMIWVGLMYNVTSLRVFMKLQILTGWLKKEFVLPRHIQHILFAVPHGQH